MARAPSQSYQANSKVGQRSSTRSRFRFLPRQKSNSQDHHQQRKSNRSNEWAPPGDLGRGFLLDGVEDNVLDRFSCRVGKAIVHMVRRRRKAAREGAVVVGEKLRAPLTDQAMKAGSAGRSAELFTRAQAFDD